MTTPSPFCVERNYYQYQIENGEDDRQRAQNTSDDEGAVVNPCPPDDMEKEESEVLRGDAIGNTAYTHRWVLNTLITITQSLPKYMGADNSNTEGEDVECEVLELSDEVEQSACQLWDMTAERDVALHLISLDVLDMRDLVEEVIKNSKAPRLTEVMVGVVANLCCHAECCDAVLSHCSLMSNILSLTTRTSDVPTLVEVFRLLKLILWHLTHRSPNGGPQLLATLKEDQEIKTAIIFFLTNSLSENLLKEMTEYLKYLMFMWLPDENCFLNQYYADNGFVEGVAIVMRQSLKSWEISGADKDGNIVHYCVTILYSFISTPNEHLISNFESNESLEFMLEEYVSKLGKVENMSELPDEKAERLTFALALCALLVPSGPSALQSNLLLSMVHLLSILNGAGHHYEALPGKTHRYYSKHHTHFENIRIQQGYGQVKSVGNRRRSSSGRKGQHSSRRTHEEMDVDSVRVPQQSSLDVVAALTDISSASPVTTEAIASNTTTNSTASVLGKKEKESINKSTHECGGLEELVESVGEFCVHLVETCPDLGTVLEVLNQCHQHEVTLFFRAVKVRKPHLVGYIQEKLLDHGTHNRLVTILANMYS